MVFRVSDWVVSRRRCDEISGDELRALVYELIEGVLPVCASCSPDDWLQMELQLNAYMVVSS